MRARNESGRRAGHRALAERGTDDRGLRRITEHGGVVLAWLLVLTALVALSLTEVLPLGARFVVLAVCIATAVALPGKVKR